MHFLSSPRVFPCVVKNLHTVALVASQDSAPEECHNGCMTTPVPIPTSTQEPVASVLRILNLTETGHDQFVAHSLPQVRRVYGGQVLAQALLAACATFEGEERLPHSLHAYFLRGGDPNAPFSLQVERLRDGRSFSSRRISCTQFGAEILSMIASFQGNERVQEFQHVMPKVPSAEELVSALEIFRMMDHPVGRFLGKTAAFDVRHVEKELYTGPDLERGGVQHLWMRPRAAITPGAAQSVHRALLAYVIDQIMFEPAMRCLGFSWLTPGMSAASLDHAMWFHRDVDMNEWLLYESEVLNVNNARALTHTRVWTREGVLVSEATQQGMLRIPDAHSSGSGNWGFGVPPESSVS